MKFTERTKLNLANVNKEVLEQWNAEDMFARDAPNSSFSKDLHQPTDILEYTT